MEFLAQKKIAIVAAWLAKMLQGHSKNTFPFFLQDQDPFRNPISETYQRQLRVLVDQLLGDMDCSKLAPALEDVIKIRAIQDSHPSQALAFILQLKGVIREQLGGRSASALDFVHERIDQMALLAFDIYQECREKICDIRVREMKRRLLQLERRHPFFAEPRQGTDSDREDGGDASEGSS